MSFIKEKCTCGAKIMVDFPPSYGSENLMSGLMDKLSEWRSRHNDCGSKVNHEGTKIEPFIEATGGSKI